MLRKTLAAAAVAAGLACTPLAAAQTPSESSVLRLVELQNLDDQLKAMVEQSLPAMVTSMMQQMPNKGVFADLDKTQQEKLQAIVVQHTVRMSGDLLTSPEALAEIRRAMTEALRETYTQKEVDAYIAFYSTEEGQAMLRKAPQMMAKFMPGFNAFFQQWHTKNAARYEAALQQDLKELAAETVKQEKARRAAKGRLKK